MTAGKPHILVLVGPTASGKSGLAIELAKLFDGEVISADSRQVYRGLTIGTGKVTKREMQRIPHHLLDVASPTKTFSADDFVQLAQRAIEDITSRGKLPIITGGTGFYIDSLVGRITLPNVPPNKALRERLETELPPALDLATTSVSDKGDTTKFLWTLRDGGHPMESVLMHYRDRATVCVSTQAGCAMACGFCATGQAGFTRQLTTGEMVPQRGIQLRLRRIG